MFFKSQNGRTRASSAGSPSLPAVLLLLAACLLSCARSDGGGGGSAVEAASYIVRLREGSAPFEVVSGEELAQLIRADALLWYEEDAELELFDGGESSGSFYYGESQWNLAMIGADAAYDCGFAGQGICVGVLDSGVNPHPDFGNRLLPGRNYMDDAEDPEDVSDTFGHGTRVAGLIAGAGESGCVGAAPLAEIVPLKCTDGQRVKVSVLCRAIYGGIDDFGCRVLNLSLGIGTDSEAMREAVDYAAERGVVLVSGVGNDGNGNVYYPAAYDSVIGVGAVDRNGLLYALSNHGKSVFLTAPGADVRTTDAQGGYIPVSGCSFAVPQAAGAAAVLLSADGTLTAGEIMDLLAVSARDAGKAGYDEDYGWGILSLSSAERFAREAASAPSCVFLPKGKSPAAAVRNNSDEPVTADYHLAEYDPEGICVGVTTVRLEIPAHGAVRIPSPDGEYAYGQFLTDPDGVPLAVCRTSP